MGREAWLLQVSGGGEGGVEGCCGGVSPASAWWGSREAAGRLASPYINQHRACISLPLCGSRRLASGNYINVGDSGNQI